MKIETLEQLEALPVGSVIGSRLVDGSMQVATKNPPEEGLEDFPWSMDERAGRFSNAGVEASMGFPLTLLIPAVVTDEMIGRAISAYRNPRRMLTNTSDGRLRGQLTAALEAALGGA